MRDGCLGSAATRPPRRAGYSDVRETEHPSPRRSVAISLRPPGLHQPPTIQADEASHPAPTDRQDPMPDVNTLQRNLAHHWGRAAMAQRMGDEQARTEALEAADACSRLLDRLSAEAQWNTLAGSPDHG